MTPDVKQMLSFYNSPLGRRTRKLLLKQVKILSSDISNKRVLGIGFSTPYLRFALEKAERVTAVLPARMGVYAWPKNEANKTVLCDPLEMPFCDSSIDLIIAVHSFEYISDSEEFMRELWRIAAPNANLVVIVPRRHGLWAQRDNTPLGFGHPFSRSQLDNLLRNHSFVPQVWSDALYLAPSNSPLLLKSAHIFEQIGRFLGATFASAMCVSAQKQLFPAIPRRKKRQRLVRMPVLKPQTAIELPAIELSKIKIK